MPPTGGIFKETALSGRIIDMDRPYYLGIDVASVSVDTAVIDANTYEVLEAEYIRHNGHPMQTAADAIRDILDRYGEAELKGMAATGSGGRVIARVLGTG